MNDSFPERCAAPVSRRAVVFLLVALVGAFSALGAAPPAHADVVVPPCAGTTETAVDPSFLTLTGAREAAYRNGEAVVLYTNDGTFGGAQETPACTVIEVDGAPASDWAYCTDLTSLACIAPTDPALAPITGNPRFAAANDPLGPDKERVVAYLAQHGYPVRDDSVSYIPDGVTRAANDSSAQRLAAQELIWCVTEAGPGAKTAAWSPCLTNFTDADFDGILALIPGTPRLEITAAATGPLEVGGVAEFTVTTNVVEQPIDVRLSADATWSVCAGSATLVDDALTVHGSGGEETVRICATAAASGAVSVDATSIPTSDRNLLWNWNGDPSCQVFATFTSVRAPRVTASARVDVRAPEAPAVPTTPEAPTVPTDGTPTSPKQTPTPSATAAAQPRISTLRVTKTSERSAYRVGERVNYRIRVTNPSTRTVRDVRVCDTFPRGLRFVRASGRPTRTNGRHCWTVRRLASGSTVTFRIVGRIASDAPRRVTNRVRVTSPDVRRTVTATRTVRVQPVAARAGGVAG